jgi:hypothetical protein
VHRRKEEEARVLDGKVRYGRENGLRDEGEGPFRADQEVPEDSTGFSKSRKAFSE